MMDVVARARGCVGARFRLHGRDPATGLDCVGLAAIAIGEPLRGASGDGHRPAREMERRATGTLPDAIVLGYYDPARDYMTGLQAARRGGVARRTETVEVPAAMSAGEARSRVEARLAAAWAARVRRTVRLPWRMAEISPGAVVTLPDAGGRWRVTEARFEKMAIALQLAGIGAPEVDVPGAAGRAVPAPDLEHGPTVLRLLDLPPLDDGPAPAPRVWIAAAGTAPGWRRAALMMTSDGGASYAPIGSTARPAVIGQAEDVLGEGSAVLIDAGNSVTVTLLHDGMALSGCSDDALVAGANVAMLGNELIQFGHAEQLGPAVWRLSRLMRGRRGSEWAVATHAAGDSFVLLDPAALVVRDLPAATLGATIGVVAAGVGDVTGVEESIVLTGRALRPPAPVGLSARRLGDGTVRFGWTRRSRVGWGWLDGTDAPLGEEVERYRITLDPGVGGSRSAVIGLPGFDYDPAMQAADGATGATTIAVRLVQIGALAETAPPCEASFAI